MLYLAFLALFLALGNMLLWIYSKKKVMLAFNLALLLLIDIAALAGINGTTAQYFNLFSSSPFALYFTLLFSTGMFFVSLLAYDYSESYQDFALLSGFALLGMLLVAFAASLIIILIGLELASLPSVFIVLLSKKNSLEPAVKYLIMSAIAVSFAALAIAIIYGATGSISMNEVGNSGYTLLALALFIASLGFEASQFPFNVLIPDIYQGSSAYATSMLGGLNKKMGFAALIQIAILIFISVPITFTVLAALSVLTMFYGNLVALAQTNLKRMLAYSSISQAGYIMIGIATATGSGISASLVQIFAHMLMFIGVLAIVAWLEKLGRSEIDDLIGLNRENKLASISMTVLMLSMIGMPFTLGFVGKFLLFLSATSSGLVWLAILGIINSVISIGYYSKAITAIFTNKYGARKIGMNYPTLFVVAACLILVILFGIYPAPLTAIASSAAKYLFSMS